MSTIARARFAPQKSASRKPIAEVPVDMALVRQLAALTQTMLAGGAGPTWNHLQSLHRQLARVLRTAEVAPVRTLKAV